MRAETSGVTGRRTPRSQQVDSTPSSRIRDVTSDRTSGLYDSNSVQDRIRQWQAQGAANAPAPDAVSVRSIPFSDCPSMVSKPKSEYGDENAGRLEGRTSQKPEEEQKKARSRSAPRKRIISDSHWKAKREGKPSKGARPDPKDRPRSTHYDLSYTSNQDKGQERGRLQRKRNSGGRRISGEITVNDDGIRIRPLQDDEGTWPAQDVHPPSDVESRADDELARQLTTTSINEHRYPGSPMQPEGHDNSNRRSKYVEMLEKAAAPSERDAPRSRKTGLFGRTKDMFVKSDTTPSLEKRLPSIEAWLDEQPDPFMDGATEAVSPAGDVPRPLEQRTQRKRSSADRPYTPDPNGIWESFQSQQERESSAPNSKRGPKSDETGPLEHTGGNSPSMRQDVNIDDQQDIEGSPSSLRRRGARHRRLRDSSRKESLPRLELQDQERLATEDGSASNGQTAASLRPQRPCPPVGQHRLSTIASVETFTESNVAAAAQDEMTGSGCELKRKLTTHEDLLSVLSQPRAGRSRRSARSKRSTRDINHTSSGNVDGVLKAFLADEERYMRELRTLVDGVIPVLLQCMLSKTDSAAAAGLFTSSTAEPDQMSFTKPIIDMGIALERLKTLHSRLSGRDMDSILGWAQTAQRAYKDYIQAWRLGFQDIVINLAPLDSSKSSSPGTDMARDEAGDLVDTEGKKVDVAYLLKRPLVRVKALSRTFSRFRDECGKPQAERVADLYADLTAMARRRHQEEQARLEDEAAANIDAMRVRDIRTMAAITGVVVNKTRRVKARDFFNLTLYHSSGQRMDCGVELILRDNAKGEPAGGDVLICEVEDTAKWLLFAPVELGSISARRGEGGFDLVVMIRGRAGLGQEWHELLALKTEDAQAVAEWMSMLGSNPLPPRLNRTSSFVKHRSPSEKPSNQADAPVQPIRSPILDQIENEGPLDVPLGEPSIIGSRTDFSQRSEQTKPLFDKPLPRLNLGGGLASKPVPQPSTTSAPRDTRDGPSFPSPDTSIKPEPPLKESVRTTVLSPISQATSPKTPPKKKPLPPRKNDELSPKLASPGKDAHPWKSSPTSNSTQASKSGIIEPHSHERQVPQQFAGGESAVSTADSPTVTPTRPTYQRALSSTPSRELPTVAKVRPQLQQSPPKPDSSSAGPRASRSRQDAKSPSRSQVLPENLPTSPSRSPRQGRAAAPSSQPGSPLAAPSVEKTTRRRTSSPLKHEYAPSTTSDDSSNYDTDGISDSDSDTSEGLMSEAGDKPTPLVAITAGGRRISKPSRPPPSSIPSTGTRTLAPSDSASQGPYRRVPSSAAVPGAKKGKTIALICSWSDKGMWEQIHPDECSVIISPGLIEAFEMSAAHSDPEAASKPDGPDSQASSLAAQPLVAFELTPIVALRRGTAIDISIRSPPTANSRIKTTSIVMFRSRNPEECEALYGMINWARCNNPTYIQLQNARPRRQPSVTFNVGQERESRSRSSSWFGFGSRQKSSYRASSAPTPASVEISVESSGTVASAFSALRKFGASSAFNLNRSSVSRKSRSGGTGGSLYSSSSGTGTGSGSSTPAPSQLGFIPGKDGPNVPSTSAAAANGGGMVNNMKIRLYVRKGQQWENLGAARLNVLPTSNSSTTLEPRQTSLAQPGDTSVDPSPPATPSHSRTPSNVSPLIVGQPGQNRGPRLPSANHTPHRVHGNGREKRLLITRNKDPGTVLLDAVLGESCFERIMQTGIAVKVWRADEVIGHTGGVTMGRETVYMMQFPGASEATWVFGLCGTNRYASISMEA